MVTCGFPGACVSLAPALCSFHSFGVEMAFSPAHTLTGSDYPVFSFQGCGLVLGAPGIDASHHAHGCDLGAGGHHSALVFLGTVSHSEPLAVSMEGDVENEDYCYY